jgi:hypothetical protein
VSSVFRELSSDTKNDSVEPTGAPSMWIAVLIEIKER